MSSSHDSSSLYKYSPVFSAPPIRTAHPVITITFRYFLLPLNLAFICWTAFMTIAFIRPTDPLIASLRARGFRRFNNLYIFLILTSVLLGSLNLIIIYCAFAHDKARRKHWIRNCLCNCHLPAPFPLLGALLGLSLVVAYPPIAAAALRVPLRDWAYGNACNAYALMAEVTVLDGFPRRQGEVDASSEVAVWKMGKRWYDMDLVRAFNSSLGWEKVREKEAPTDEDIRLVMSGREPVKVWPSLMRNGTFEMMLRVRDGVGYFNVSGLVQDQLRGLKTDIPGPVARVRFDLVEKRYEITYTNTTAPGFPATTAEGGFSAVETRLEFPELRLEQVEEGIRWRFLEKACLPPRVFLKDRFQSGADIVAEMSSGCRKMRVCALRKEDLTAKGWQDRVEVLLPVIVGPIAWEFEAYSKCCRRNE